jgi:hypothetical protein
MPWNFQIVRGNASGENIGAVPEAQLLLSSELSQTPVFIGFSNTMSGVQKFRIFDGGWADLIHPRHEGVGVLGRRAIRIQITMGIVSRPPIQEFRSSGFSTEAGRT